MRARLACAAFATAFAAIPAATQAPDPLRTGRWEEHLYLGEYRPDEALDPSKTPIPAKYYCVRPADANPGQFLARTFKASACKPAAAAGVGAIDLTTVCPAKGVTITTRFKGSVSPDFYRINVEFVERQTGGGKGTGAVTVSGRWRGECKGDEPPIEGR